MSQGQTIPKMIPLDFDSATKSHYMALPDFITRADAEVFRELSGRLFEFQPNSGQWLSQRGLTYVDGITVKTQVIIIAQDLFDRLKSLYNEWILALLELRNRATAHRGRPKRSLPLQLAQEGV